jgi:coatomer subunit beta'
VALWRESLSQLNEKAGQSLADPKDYENLFPGYAEALKTEQFLKSERQQLLPSSEYPNIAVSILNNGELLSMKWKYKFLKWQL